MIRCISYAKIDGGTDEVLVCYGKNVQRVPYRHFMDILASPHTATYKIIDIYPWTKEELTSLSSKILDNFFSVENFNGCNSSTMVDNFNKLWDEIY